MNCRVCSGETTEVLNLGNLYPSAFLAEGEEPRDRFPLTLVECNKCGLVQLKDNPPLDTMYRQYWYRSGLNKSMVADLADIVKEVERKIVLSPGDLVLDIGCNDGTLFKTYTQQGLITVGYDPALNLYPECSLFFNNYFPDGSQLSKKARVITSIAVFYDIPAPKEFIAGIKENLAEDGIWVIQLTDLCSMLKATAFDNICHEHLEYYSLRILVDLMADQGLEVFDVDYNTVNGGSLRAFVSWPGAYCKTSRVSYFLAEETKVITVNWEKWFHERILERKAKTCDYLYQAKSVGKTIALLGASTKGNTLLQVFGLDETLIDHAAEINPEKFGLYPIGTKIPIISEQESLKLSPDIYLVLPWHFASTFIKNEKFTDYMLRGGTLLFPLPEVMVWNEQDGKISGRYVL